MEHKDELIKKKYALSDRLRLFDAVVTPAVLYGAGTWTLTKEMERALRTTQRRMLRAILGQGRRRMERTTESINAEENGDSGEDGDNETPEEDDIDLLEPWVEWIRRVTHNAENNLKRFNIKTWVEQARTRKWRLAAELYSGRGEQKWTHLALQWNPQMHYDGTRPTARRTPTRPNLRWTDELHNFIRDNMRIERTWSEVCSDPEFWKRYESCFTTDEH